MSAPQPDLTKLYFEDAGLLLFAPADLADSVQATRDVLAEARTWGDATRALPRYRLEELRAEVLDKDAPFPCPDEPLADLDGWPALSYSDMPSWLPALVAERFGHKYVGRVDSGTNFDIEDWGAIEEALEALGISVSYAPMSLEEIFD